MAWTRSVWCAQHGPNACRLSHSADPDSEHPVNGRGRPVDLFSLTSTNGVRLGPETDDQVAGQIQSRPTRLSTVRLKQDVTRTESRMRLDT